MSNKRQAYSKGPFLRKRRKFRLILEDESRLERVWSIRSGPWRILLVALLLVLAGFGLGVLTVGFTPVKRQVPGFMTGDDRTQAMNSILRLDSLQQAIQTNQAFLDNLSAIMNVDRQPADSTDMPKPSTAPLSLDSLIGSSARERKFVTMMEESEKYNLKVLAPLAAEGLIWSDPVPDGIVVEQSRTLPMLQVIVPKGRGVKAMADGRIIDISYDATARTYSLMLQHGKGFMSRYSSLGRPLIEKGAQVLAGQMLSEGSRTASIGIEMWRDGTPLLPAEYVGRPGSSVPEQAIDSPRGK